MDKWLDLIGASAERAPWGWGVLIVIVGALIKVWPVVQLQVIEAKAKLRGEKKDALDDCQVRLDAMDLRLTAAEERAHSFELQLVGALSAYGILEAEVASTNPHSIGLVQAKAVLARTFKASAAPGDMADALHRMP